MAKLHLSSALLLLVVRDVLSFHRVSTGEFGDTTPVEGTPKKDNHPIATALESAVSEALAPGYVEQGVQVVEEMLSSGEDFSVGHTTAQSLHSSQPLQDGLDEADTDVPWPVPSLGGSGGTGNNDASASSVEVSWKRRKALIVDVSGPNRSMGEGVRVMAMVVDLQGEDCSYEVHVLSTCDVCTWDSYMWDSDVGSRFSADVRLWNQDTFFAMGPDLFEFDKIIMGGKLTILEKREAGNLISAVLPRLIQNAATFREKTWTFWDDVPFIRCQYKDLCDDINNLVGDFVQASHAFYVLTPGDADRMEREMSHRDMQTVPLSVWPMRIGVLEQILPPIYREQPVITENELATKRYLTLMGNLHAVNMLNLEPLFTSGTIKRICEAISSQGSGVKLLFLGALAEYAQELYSKDPKGLHCVEIRDGVYVTNAQLKHTIWPETRAIMNPFFFDVQSGISVKSFEAVKDGIPFVTSAFGLHGLEEIRACRFPVAKEATPESFGDYIISNVLPDDAYRAFSSAFLQSSCDRGQNSHYPLRELCA